MTGRTVLVTGGAGFIGSHTVAGLLEGGDSPVVFDNFSHSSPAALERVRNLSGRPFPVIAGDVRDRQALDGVFARHPVDAVIHFAGLKAVGESVSAPLPYYQNNVAGTLSLLEAMQTAGCRNLIFSSSAAVYGHPARMPVTEDMPLCAVNPYGRTKVFIEEILRDLAGSEAGWHIALLRYFNPVGAHPSGLIGEEPRGVPSNLMPYLLQVASGRQPRLLVHGGDYPTPDGTGVRDFIHIMDLAGGHLATLDALQDLRGAEAFNLGTGTGYSVLDLVKAMERTVGHALPVTVGPRRAGDVPVCYSDPGLAFRRLGWRAERDLAAMCEDGWRWANRRQS